MNHCTTNQLMRKSGSIVTKLGEEEEVVVEDGE
jgi:hypothetical protein